MKHVIASLLWMFALTGGAAAQQTALRPQPPPERLQPPSHTVVVVSGDVAFKRQEWNQFAPARFGTVLRPGDLVRFEPGASILVVCDGFAAAITMTGPGAKPVSCPAESLRNPLWQRRIPVIPTTQIDVPSSLTMVAAEAPAKAVATTKGDQLGKSKMSSGLMKKAEQPEAHTILATYEQTPAFSWLAVPGADAYELNLTGPGVAWKDLIYTNDTFSASDLPTLAAGSDYVVSVVPMLNKQPLKTDTVRALQALMMKRFEVLQKPKEADVSAATGGIAKLGLPVTVVTFLTAKTLARLGLFDVAITSLLSIQDQLKEPALSRELGEVYLARLSYSEAAKSLADAATLSERNGDVLGRALAEEALANIEAKTPDQLGTAVARFRVALEIYRRLGDQANVKRLEGIVAGHSALGTTQSR